MPANTVYLPAGDSELLNFAQNYSSKITAGPIPLGLTAGIATILSGYVTAFQTKLAALNDPLNRNPVAFQQKDEAKGVLVAYIRETARQIQGTMTVTDDQRTELRLTIRDTNPTPVEPIIVPPALKIISIFGRNIRIQVRDASGTARGRPATADGAIIYSFIGPTAPAGTEGWTCEGPITKDSTIINFPESTAVGARVWLTAQWFNTKGSGPGCTPVAAVIGAEGALAA